MKNNISWTDLTLCWLVRHKFVNGEEFKEDGKFKTVSGMDVIVTKGSYTIVEKDGSITVVNYTADEHGVYWKYCQILIRY